MAKITPYSNQELDYIKSNYQKISTALIAKNISQISGNKRSRKAIEQQARRLKLVKRTKWSQAEYDYLTELIGEYPFKTLVEKYQEFAETKGFQIRSEGQIKSKINHLKQSIRLNASSKYLTKQDIKFLLGCDRTTATNIFKQYQQELKPKQDGGKQYVLRSTFKKFLLNHTSVLIRHQKKLDIAWLVDILTN